MTIQISVLIWTIICFFLLMLILNRLLFRPLLNIMDRRKEKTAAAQKEKEAAQLARENEIQALKDERQSLIDAANAPELLQAARQESTALLEKKQAEYDELLEQKKQALKSESEALFRALEPKMNELSAAVADRLTHN